MKTQTCPLCPPLNSAVIGQCVTVAANEHTTLRAVLTVWLDERDNNHNTAHVKTTFPCEATRSIACRLPIGCAKHDPDMATASTQSSGAVAAPTSAGTPHHVASQPVGVGTGASVAVPGSAVTPPHPLPPR